MPLPGGSAVSLALVLTVARSNVLAPSRGFTVLSMGRAFPLRERLRAK
jgi:hypothetical protein